MKALHNTLLPTLAATLVCCSTHSLARDPDLIMSAGAEYSSGDYGGEQTIEEWYVPVTLKYVGKTMGYGVTIPYLAVRAPEGTIITDGEGQVISGSGEKRTESGLGDIIGRLTFYDVYRNDELDIAVDIGAKIKLGTADEDKGLGTGKTDYSLQVSLFKFFDRHYLSGTMGYKVRGEPDELELEDVWFASIAGVYRYSADTKAGVAFDYRQSSFDDGDNIRELSVFVYHRLDDTWGVSAYSYGGLSDSSPDFGLGASIKYYY